MTESSSSLGNPEASPEWQRPPFTPGNLAAVKSGYRSPRIVGEVADRIADELLGSAPLAADYPEELASVATMEAVLVLMRRDVAERGIHNPDGSLRGAFLDRLFTAERQAARARDRLGLSPTGEATIARARAVAATLTVDLEQIAAHGRAALDAAQRSQPLDFAAPAVQIDSAGANA